MMMMMMMMMMMNSWMQMIQTHQKALGAPKEPAYPHTCISSLINDFGATNFIPCLHAFLRTLPLTFHSILDLLSSTQLPVFKCLTVQLPAAPQVTKHVTKDVICA